MGIKDVKAGPGTLDLNEFVGTDPYFVLVFRSATDGDIDSDVDMAVQLSGNMMEENNLDLLPNALLAIAQSF